MKFESGFSESTFYNRQTQDDEHLAKFLKAVDLNGSILDLGTGSGYLAFPMADLNSNCHVIGLDIVQETLKRNRQKVAEQDLANLDFVSYDGINFPFSDQSFDTIVTRYALHHFPNIQRTFREIIRILKQGGQLVISDPTLNDNDTNRFVDVYMQMKDDGHIKYYTRDEFENLAESIGLKLEYSFISKIRFHRKRAGDYYKILNSVDANILNGYAIEIKGDEIFITQRVLNLYFRNS
jgi:ubiquinone/menaquinone biosynthesis C-methylase UbiE